MLISDAFKYFLYLDTMPFKKAECLCYYAHYLHLALFDYKLMDTEFISDGFMRNIEIRNEFENLENSVSFYSPARLSVKPLITQRNARYLDMIYRMFGKIDCVSLDMQIAQDRYEISKDAKKLISDDDIAEFYKKKLSFNTDKNREEERQVPNLPEFTYPCLPKPVLSRVAKNKRRGLYV